MCVIERMKKAVSLLLAMVLLLQYIPAPAFAEETPETGLCEHHAVHENCGYVAAVAGADCTHEHDDSCFTTKCAHVHGECGYAVAVEGVACDHVHDSACGYAEAVAEVPCTCQQEVHTEECGYEPAIPVGECNHVHGECSFVEARSEIPCGHDCTQEETCGEKVLSCNHIHDENCGYVSAGEGKPCEIVCEACAAEEASTDAVAEVKDLMDTLPALEVIQAKSLEEQQMDYNQVQAAYDAYEALTESQKVLLPAPEDVFKPYFDYFNNQIAEDDVETITTGTCGENLIWSFNKATGTLSISGSGKMSHFYDKIQPWETYNDQIITVVVEEGVETLGTYSLFECEAMTQVYLPASLTGISENALPTTGSLAVINVALENPDYCTEDGVLYTKDKQALMKYPAEKAAEDFTIPKSVTVIAFTAFAGCNNLNTLTFSGSAPFIDETSFDDTILTARYPANESAWTEEVIQNYGGTITWIPYEDEHVHEFDEEYNCECGAVGGSCGENLTWLFDKKDGTLNINGSGSMKNYDTWMAPWYFFKEDILHICFSDGITAIGDYAFYDCNNIKSLVIPNSVEKIGDHSFDMCTNLVSILIPNNVTFIGKSAFSNCHKLVNFTIPNKIRTIKEVSFLGCENLVEIIIPSSVENIEYGVFSCCRSLQKVIFTGNSPNFLPRDTHPHENHAFYEVAATVYYPANNSTWTDDVLQNYAGTINWVAYDGLMFSGTCGQNVFWTFDGEVGILSISGSGSMYNYSNENVPWLDHYESILSVTVADGVTNVGEAMFRNCPNLKQLSIPGTVTEIAYGAFADCNSLTKVDVPSSVTTISYNAFANCTNLIEVSIPNSVKEIKDEAFRNCSSLTEVTLPESVTEIAYATFADCSSLTEVNIPDSVTTIAYNAFDSCSNLTEVNLPANVTEISYSAFADCTSLQQITIPQNVTKVAYGAFSDCTSLETVTLPTDLSSLSEGAFKNCDNLTTVIFPENMTAVGTQALKAFPNVTTIRFTGDAPAFDSNAFLGVTADAYYPADKAGWTSNVLQNYGGNITWIAVNNDSGGSGSGSTPVAPPASGGTDTGTGGTTTGNTTRPTTPVTPTVPPNTVTDVIVIEKTDMDTAIDAAGNAGHTEVEISAEDKGDGKTVSLPVESLEEITDADLSLSVVTKDATITFDTEALDAIVQQAGGKEIQLQYQEIKEAKLNNQQKRAIKDQLSDHKGQKHVLTFTVELTGAGEKIHDFRGGTATIRIPFELPKGTKAEDYAVFYLNSNGEIERYETTYDGKYLIVQLKHFSEYAVVYEPDVAETEPTEAVPEIAAAEVSAVAAAFETSEVQAPSGFQIPVWLILMVAALLCVIALIFILRKRF